MKMRSIAFELTPRCNQRCLYCYNAWRHDAAPHGGELRTDQVCALVDKVLAEADLDHVTLTGGEPFLREDILDIIGHINARGLRVAIISNGRLVDERMAGELARRQVAYVQLTLLGADPPTHDALCGAGSHDGVTGAAERLAAAGVPVGGSFLCTRQNSHAAGATLELMRQLGIRHHVAFNRFNPSGPAARAAALMPTRSQVLAALCQAEAFAARHDVRIHCTMPIPHCMVDEAGFPHVDFGVCSAATDQGEPAIDPTGSVKLCTLQRESIGSLFDRGLRDLLRGEALRRARERLPAFCAACPHGPSCRGGCGAAAEWVFSNPNALDPFLAQHVEAQ